MAPLVGVAGIGLGIRRATRPCERASSDTRVPDQVVACATIEVEGRGLEQDRVARRLPHANRLGHHRHSTRGPMGGRVLDVEQDSFRVDDPDVGVLDRDRALTSTA